MPDFEKLAEEWILGLEREYWEETRCHCKEMLINMLKHVYEQGKKDR